MSARRVPQAPPDLPGFTYVDLLGSGGFADVYLYEQHLPRRRVAVKVLLTERLTTGSVSEFTAEANVMAMLSTHPAIVTIYQAGVAGDGRPYLVMEYCSRPNLQVRYRREPFSVAESLRIGIQVAGAVETAHRAGVLHRDIKPANVLVTEYNRPALTDFGIASTMNAASAANESSGLSIPWSPPESFADAPRSDPRSDVYALGATVYTLLAGHSPFELPGERNSAADLIQRIETARLPALGRADTPVSLQRVLERAMSKTGADRYASAVEFARALQKVQIELSHSVTPIDILDDGVPEDVEDDEDDGLTRVRGVVSIAPETAPAAGRTRQNPGPRAMPGFVPPPPGSAVPGPAAFAPTTPVPAGDDATVLRAPVTIADAAPAAGAKATGGRTGGSAGGSAGGSVDDTGRTVRRIGDASALPATATPGAPGAGEAAAGADERSPQGRRGLTRATLWSIAGAAVIVVAVIAVAALAVPALLGPAPAPSASGSPTSAPVDVLPAVVQPPAGLAGAVTPAGVVFTWSNPDPQDGDSFLWAVATVGAEPQFQRTTEPTVTVPAAGSGSTCLTVVVRRANGTSSADATACSP